MSANATTARPPAAEGPATRAPARASTAARRVGYVIAIACNAAGLWISHQLLDWGWPRFLTPSFDELLPILTVSFVAGMVVNALFIVADPPWFKSLCNMVTAGISLVVSVRTLQVFPFDFSSYSRDWSTALRVLVIIAAVGSAIAMVANLVAMLRHLPGGRDSAATPGAGRAARVATPPSDTTAAQGGSGRAVVVYESMFGATHEVADHVAQGLGASYQVTTMSVHDATAQALQGVDLVVVGGPTHVHGMSSHWTRESAVDMAAEPDNDLNLDPDAEGEGLREWFHELPELAGVRAAAFDTRIGSVSALMSGQASKGIARRLRQHGLAVVAGPESFVVDEDNHLAAGEAERATEWGRSLAGVAVGVV